MLDELPLIPPVHASPATPSGMSDLPSDTEDMFFMEEEEAEDYQRRKRLQMWEAQRQARILAMNKQERCDAEENCTKKEEEDTVSGLNTRQLNMSSKLIGVPSPSSLRIS
jgi:hypothetical protein